MIQIHHGDATHLPYPDDHFDCLVTDPPYGYGFMGKDWDKTVVGVDNDSDCIPIAEARVGAVNQGLF